MNLGIECITYNLLRGTLKWYHPISIAATLGPRDSPDFGGKRNALSHHKALLPHCLVSGHFFPQFLEHLVCDSEQVLGHMVAVSWFWCNSTSLLRAQLSPRYEVLPCFFWNTALAQERLEENANSVFLLCLLGSWGHQQWFCLDSSGLWGMTRDHSWPLTARDSIKALEIIMQLSFLTFPRVLLPSVLISIILGSK